MNVQVFIEKLKGVEFFTGVPDSQIKPFCDYLTHTYGISKHHIIAANEGNAVALATGYHLSTGKIPCVYLQNSGLGNAVNPITSLTNPLVYGIPTIFIVGWRGEPGVHDEPQHVYQGKVTLQMLEVLDIAYLIVDKNTTETDLENKMVEFSALLSQGKSVAFVMRKDALTYSEKVKYANTNPILREAIIKEIVQASKEDILVSTTGKTSRELFEIREQGKLSHQYDFLTVGSMGHSSSIALGIALNKPHTKVWCIDGDGAAIMHMGAMALIGDQACPNLIHVMINNGAHESVGGQPTVANTINFEQIARGCGYKAVYSVHTLDELKIALSAIASQKGPIFIEMKSAIGSRDDLGRPTSTPAENKDAFMAYLRKCD